MAVPRWVLPPPEERAVALALVLTASFSAQFGSAVAVFIIPTAGPLGVLVMRLGFAALLLLLVFRPSLRGRSRTDWAAVLALGVTLAGLNSSFYAAIERIPLGVAVTVELLGPLVLSVVVSRRLLSLLWAGLALLGVALLGGITFAGLDLIGVFFAALAGVMWASYIVANQRVGRRFARADGLALAMCIAAVLILPIGISLSGSVLLSPAVLGIGAAVAVMSSALPYTLEMAALRRLPQSVFAVLLSLAPAIASFAGFLLLDQHLGILQIAGIALVIVASTGAMRSRASPPRTSR